MTVDHGRTSDLLVRLRAPSGATAEVGLERRDGGFEQFVFTGSAENGLLRLADESILGQWELSVFDRLSGESGRLVSWGLSFPGVPQSWDDTPIEGISLPEPLRTEQVDVALAGDGRKAISIPSRAETKSYLPARPSVRIHETFGSSSITSIFTLLLAICLRFAYISTSNMNNQA